MNPTLFAILVIVGMGIVVGILSGTKVEKWIKEKSAWVICVLMLLGIVAFMIKMVLYGIYILIGLFAKIFS